MKRILIQFDTDPLPSVFDRVVAVDVGVDHLFSYGDVTAENVTGLVHGAMFTRSPADLKNTAIFISGTDVEASQSLLEAVGQTIFAPMQVSVMADPSGCNTTAAAAVCLAGKHVSLKETDALVLGGTGPVGRRVAQLLAGQGASVRVASRAIAKAEQACTALKQRVPGAKLTPCEFSDDALAAAVDGVELIVAAGAAGVQFLAAEEWQGVESLRVAIDLNAVPPLGLAGIEASDGGTERDGKICYGALGVGGLKMKVHRAALEKLFAANDQVLDTVEIYDIACGL